MTPKTYATTSGVIFALVAALHLLRVVTQSAFIVGGWSMPYWVSLIAAAVAGFLSYSGLRSAGASR